jgi:hypothetical protein
MWLNHFYFGVKYHPDNCYIYIYAAATLSAKEKLKLGSSGKKNRVGAMPNKS